ncbi:AAA family ATPase [Devosia rhizoryzae]|uniref:non-specific protein-tyrosine kinase n=1 Tax=Devosia rhizoryzae TaxID=2774137 RepID=A0ABX7CAZ3_9HYPH|nr:AAA family ATPase [Devosia rhizoryzae]
MQRQLRLILVLSIVVLTAAVVVVLSLTPIYTATTLVMVDPADKNVLAPQSSTGSVAAADARIEGEVLLARSDNVLLTVIEREGLVGNPEFNHQPGLVARFLSFLRLREPVDLDPDQVTQQALAKLARMTSVQRHRATYLLSISVASEDPDQAASLANAVAAAYIDTQLTAKVQSTMDARTKLLEQLDTARQDVVGSDGSFDRYVSQNLATIIDQTGNAELSRIKAELDRLGERRADEASELTALQKALGEQDFAALSSRLADPELTSLEAQRQVLLSAITEPSDEEARTAQLSSLDRELQSRATALIDGRRALVQEIQSDEASQSRNLRLAILSSALSSDTLTEIYDLQQRAELARQQYDQLQARSQQLQAEATLQLPDSRVVSPALRPADPSFPNTGIFLILAALSGLALGIGVAFIYENFIGGITTDEQLAALSRTSLALSIPRAKTQPSRGSVSDLILETPLSAFSEAIRRVRTNVDHQLTKKNFEGQNRAPVIAVTSTVPGEGKTTAALALAQSFALSGRKTLLVDCDLRRPGLHEHLGLAPAQGLIDALAADDPGAALKSAMVTDEDTKLLVLLGSHRSAGATDQLVTSRNFDKLIAGAARAFDVVILDTPPLGPVVDGLYIARKADAVIFLVQWASTSQQDVRRSLLALDGAIDDRNVLVPVLNRQEVAASSWHRRYAHYYSQELG